MPSALQGPLPAQPAMPGHAASDNQQARAAMADDQQARAAMASYCLPPASEPTGLSRAGTGRPPSLGVIHSGFLAPHTPAGSGFLAPPDPAGPRPVPLRKGGKRASFCDDYVEGSYPPSAPSLGSSSQTGPAAGSRSESRFPSPRACSAGSQPRRPLSASHHGPGLDRGLRRSRTTHSLDDEGSSRAAAADMAVCPSSTSSAGGSAGSRRSLVPPGGLSQTSSFRRRESCFG